MTRSRLFELWILRDDALLSALCERGVSGLEERSRNRRAFWVAYAGSKREANDLAERIRELGISVEIEEVDGSRWQTEWMRYLKPESITETIVLAPRGTST